MDGDLIKPTPTDRRPIRRAGVWIALAATLLSCRESAGQVRHSYDSTTIVRPSPQVIQAAAPVELANSSPRHAVVSALTEDQASTGGQSGNRPHSTPIAEALNRKGSVTFRKTPLAEAVFLLSELWHINIVAGESVSGEVSGAFHDAPLREVLAAALTASGYSYRQTGNSLIVLPIDDVGADDPEFVSQMIRLPPDLDDLDSTIEAVQLLLSQRGQSRVVGTGGLLVVDTPARVDRIRDLLTELSPGSRAPASPPPASLSAPDSMANASDLSAAGGAGDIIQNGIAYFSPQFTEADEMAEPLREALGEDVVVAVYPEENRIMVKGNAAQLSLAEDAISQLDVPRQQVRITAMIYDVGLSELEELGLNLSRDLRAIAVANNEALESVASNVDSLYVFTSNLASGGAAQLGIRTITDTLGANVLLEALDATAEAKLLADPSITVGDRRQASIRIVRKIPIVGANPVENSNAVFTQTEFEEAGVILTVQPRISRDGTIELQVSPEYSVVAELTATGPVIDSRTADTTVRVGDGQMFVLGGLRQKSIVESKRGIPYLQDVKYVGAIFRSHRTEVRESELIVFLKPELVTPYSPGSLREQQAACVAQGQLDRIPYASTRPQTPCCVDHYCPNHYPRCRINGGSQELGMMGGHGIECMPLCEQVIDSRIGQDRPLETLAPPMSNSHVPTATPTPSPQRAPESRRPVEAAEQVDVGFAPVHIDTAFSGTSEAAR